MFQGTPLSESAADATDLTEVDLVDLVDLTDFPDATDRSPGVLTADLWRLCRDGVLLMASYD